jgi:hypothetical protein
LKGLLEFIGTTLGTLGFLFSWYLFWAYSSSCLSGDSLSIRTLFELILPNSADSFKGSKFFSILKMF